MPVTVISRPYGHKLIDSVLSATVSDSSGDALITTAFSHALVDGDYIYVDSNFESLNGYKYVDAISPTTFKLRDSEGSDTITFKQTGTISYQTSVLNHGWIAAHQPIVYELKSDLWPENILEESYSPVTVTGSLNYNGYTNVTFSGSITDPTVLSYITIGGEVYQIIIVNSSTDVVINLAYDASNDLSGPVLKYYNNYTINVGVWLGLSNTHRWAAEKPYALVANLSFIPDSENKVNFSISEIVRSYINTRNNLALDTLPNNLDFHTGFYITYAEAYDVSNGVTVMRAEVNQTNDKNNFEGHAVNASMPFKSLSINAMSDYVNEDVYLAKWLTIQDRPIAMVGRFFDLSFINSLDGEIDIEILVNGVLNQTITNPGIGVIRVPLEFLTAGEYCVYAHTPGVAPVPPPSPPTLQALASWTNGPGSLPWSLGANPATSVNGNGGLTNYIVGTFAGLAGVDHKFSYDLDLTSGTMTFTVRAALLDGSYNVLDSVDFLYTTSGNKVETDFVLNPPTSATYFGITCINNTPVNSKSIDINSASFNGFVSGGGGDGTPGIDAQTLTETICIDVIDTCDNSVIPTVDDVRLLEDGDYRLLE